MFNVFSFAQRSDEIGLRLSICWCDLSDGDVVTEEILSGENRGQNLFEQDTQQQYAMYKY